MSELAQTLRDRRVGPRSCGGGGGWEGCGTEGCRTGRRYGGLGLGRQRYARQSVAVVLVFSLLLLLLILLVVVGVRVGRDVLLEHGLEVPQHPPAGLLFAALGHALSLQLSLQLCGVAQRFLQLRTQSRALLPLLLPPTLALHVLRVRRRQLGSSPRCSGRQCS